MESNMKQKFTKDDILNITYWALCLNVIALLTYIIAITRDCSNYNVKSCFEENNVFVIQENITLFIDVNKNKTKSIFKPDLMPINDIYISNELTLIINDTFILQYNNNNMQLLFNNNTCMFNYTIINNKIINNGIPTYKMVGLITLTNIYTINRHNNIYYGELILPGFNTKTPVYCWEGNNILCKPKNGPLIINPATVTVDNLINNWDVEYVYNLNNILTSNDVNCIDSSMPSIGSAVTRFKIYDGKANDTNYTGFSINNLYFNNTYYSGVIGKHFTQHDFQGYINAYQCFTYTQAPKLFLILMQYTVLRYNNVVNTTLVSLYLCFSVAGTDFDTLIYSYTQTNELNNVMVSASPTDNTNINYFTSVTLPLPNIPSIFIPPTKIEYITQA